MKIQDYKNATVILNNFNNEIKNQRLKLDIKEYNNSKASTIATDDFKKLLQKYLSNDNNSISGDAIDNLINELLEVKKIG